MINKNRLNLNRMKNKVIYCHICEKMLRVQNHDYFDFRRPLDVLEASLETPASDFWPPGDRPSDKAKRFVVERTDARGLAD